MKWFRLRAAANYDCYGRRAQQKKPYLMFFNFRKLILFGILDFILHVCFFSEILWQPKNPLYSAVFHFHV